MSLQPLHTETNISIPTHTPRLAHKSNLTVRRLPQARVLTPARPRHFRRHGDASRTARTWYEHDRCIRRFRATYSHHGRCFYRRMQESAHTCACLNSQRFFEHPFTAVPWLCVYLSHVALATSCTRFCSGTCLSGHIFKYGTRPMAINVALALEPRQVGRFRGGLIISRRCCDEVTGLSWRYNNAFINTHCCKNLRQLRVQTGHKVASGSIFWGRNATCMSSVSYSIYCSSLGISDSYGTPRHTFFPRSLPLMNSCIYARISFPGPSHSRHDNRL